MRIDIFTLFPAMFIGPFTESILKRAQEKGLLEIHLHNIRDFTTDKHHVTDDTPYGGGGGMIMKVDPIVAAVEQILGDALAMTPIILTTPTGAVFNQATAKEWASQDRLVFLCGRYEGVDDRVRELIVTDEISIGDYVLTGGELPTMVMIDAISRHIPGVLGAENAADEDSHATGLLEYPQYTRPAEFRGRSVPTVLVNGNHALMNKWKREQSIRRTFARRPEMLLTATLTDKEKYLLATLAMEWVNQRRKVQT